MEGNKVAVGAQDLYTEDAGAFTGAVSPGMVQAVGCSYVLCGHSERRSVFGDSDEMVNKKVRLLALRSVGAMSRSAVCM